MAARGGGSRGGKAGKGGRRGGVSFDPDRAARELEAELRSRGDPVRAIQEKRYLKSEREHFGVTVPGIRAAVVGWAQGRPGLARPDLLALVARLWDRPAHECRFAAVELLERFGPLLEPTDLAFLQQLIRESGTWALVDGLAATVAGGLVELHPELAEALDAWAQDPDFWVRRSALLALLGPLRQGEGDFERFGRYADGMLEEKEFFIRKAIGWVLRETGKKRPERVHTWLLPRAARASGLTVREAVKPLPAALRDEILEAREGKATGAGGKGTGALPARGTRRKV
jgi:3-methyladenine DNA glycosylase AlkD